MIARALLVVCSVFLFAACPSEEERDRVPPRVLSIEPSSPIVPVTVSFRVTFSESLNRRTVGGDPLAEDFSVGLFPSEGISDTFLSDFDNPPLIESRADDMVAAALNLVDDDTAIELVPAANLQPGVEYTLLVSSEVRDPSGNPLVDGAGNKALFRWDFTTDAGPPKVLSTTLPAGAELVVPNRRRIDVTFNQPVQNVSEATLFIQGAPTPVIDAILLDETRTNATLLLGVLDTGCERLASSDTYTLVATDGIIGDNEQALEPFTDEFSTGASCDLTAHTLVGAAEAIAGETDATIRFSTSKASTTEVRFGVSGGDLDCLGLPCPVLGAAARTPSGSVPVSFLHSAVLSGLTLGETYAYVVSAEDDVGQTASASGTFVTAPLPEIAINELMADPPDVGTTNEPRDEYIELVNFGGGDIVLDGYTLDIDGGDAAGGDSCPLGALTIPAGGYRILVGESFVPETYGTVDATTIVRSDASSFCASLRNTSSPALQSFVLKDAGGRPVSTFTAYGDLVPHEEGFSIERTAPDAPDVAGSFCRSHSAVGPTPGRENGVVSQGCE